MCEVLIRVKNVVDLTPGGVLMPLAKVSKMEKMGDVILLRDDGFDWRPAELGTPVAENSYRGNHSFWRVLKFPKIALQLATKMLTRELDIDPQNRSPYLQARAFFIDKTKIPPATAQNLIDHWNDDGRANGFLTLQFTAAQLNSVITSTDDVNCPAYHKRIAFP